MFTEFAKFYVTDFDDYREYIYLNNLPPEGSETFCDDDYRELAVKLEGCYDWERGEWNDDRVYFCAQKALVEAFGEDAELVWRE